MTKSKVMWIPVYEIKGKKYPDFDGVRRLKVDAEMSGKEAVRCIVSVDL
jgi:hypothetical protein